MTRAAVLLAALGLLITGCTPADPADGDPTPTPSASPTTAAPPPPTLPAQAQEDDPNGAIAFVDHYVKAQDWATIHLDTRPLAELAHPRCETCSRTVARLNDLRETGGMSGDPRSTAAITSSFRYGDIYLVKATITNSRHRYQESAESKPGIVRSGSYRRWYRVRSTPQGLLMLEITRPTK